MQIVALDDQIAIEPGLSDPLVRVHFQRAKWHGKVMIIDEFLALEIQLGHAAP